VHLRDPDLGRDLGLGELVEEPELDDLTLALVERVQVAAMIVPSSTSA
jgi:hypothetical protein